MNHTPGPWKAKGKNGKYDNRKNKYWLDSNTGSTSAAPITLADGTVIALVVESGDNVLAENEFDSNAALIAAAPELYSMLAELVTASNAMKAPLDIRGDEPVKRYAYAMKQASSLLHKLEKGDQL